uniref:Centrocin 2 n=1 Tax=Strongylocentrotus droebachiensis TaxID=7671 RepID=D8WN04_STRDR|nr:centrocin 2 [Strongylocentrotus droebachiensis]ADI95440.1 centrocin 2 [Strongylocentrotus droebachiensis]
MMIKVALVLCAIVATSMVCAKNFEEQDALDTLLNLMLSEEAASPDAVALQSWFSRTVHNVGNAVRKGIHAGQGVCSGLGLSPEEARVKILSAVPEMREEDLSEEDLRAICAGAHALGR